MEDKTRGINQIEHPCAACKVGRRKCGAKCSLAPYFPPDNPYKFLVAQRIFGRNNILKILRDVPPQSRDDAVESMVYEASARVRDPLYGCTGAICRLQKQLLELQSELASTKAELEKAQATHASLTAGFYNTGHPQYSPFYVSQPILQEIEGTSNQDEQADRSGLWQTLWT